MITVKCPRTPFGFECLAHRRSTEGPCELRALPLFEVVFRSGGKLVSDGIAEFKQVAEHFAGMLRRRGVSASVRPYRPKEKA